MKAYKKFCQALYLKPSHPLYEELSSLNEQERGWIMRTGLNEKSPGTDNCLLSSIKPSEAARSFH